MSDEQRICEAIEAFRNGRPGALAADADVVGTRRPAAGGGLSIRFLRGDVAIARLSGPVTTTLVLSRTDGVWKIDAAHTSR